MASAAPSRVPPPKKAWNLKSCYDDSDPKARTLESEILEKRKITKQTLYADLPAAKFPREDGYILGIQLFDEEDLGIPPPTISHTPVCPINLEELSEDELISVSEPAYGRIVSLSDLKEAARLANNKLAEKYKALESTPSPKGKKEAFPDWFKSQIWRKAHGSIEKAQCPVCSMNVISAESFSAGHILAESKGGMMCSENIIPICPECNSQMGTRHLYWFAWHYYGKVLWPVY